MSPVRGSWEPSLPAAPSKAAGLFSQHRYLKHIVRAEGADCTAWCNPESARHGKGPHGFFHSLNIYIKLLATLNILIILHENTWMLVGLIFLISYFKCELFGVNDSVYGLRRDVLFHVLVKDRQYNWTGLLNLEEFAKGVHGWMGAGGILSNSSDHSLIKGAPHEALKSSILSSDFTKLSECVE